MSLQRIQEFTENASPDNWLKYADELRQTALTLWENKGNRWLEISSGNIESERPAVSRSFMLVAGLAIENTLKANLVAVDPSLINTGILDKKLQEHNLTKLAALTKDIEFSEKEMELMEIFSEAIPYWGRYPIPRHFNNIKTEKILSEEVYSTFTTLFRKVFYKTLDLIKNGWDAGNGVSFNEIHYHNFDDEKYNS
jgi:hypothetical protein